MKAPTPHTADTRGAYVVPLKISEAGTVQFPMVAHAVEIGWTPISPDEARTKRGGDAGTFLRDVLEAKLAAFNPWLTSDAVRSLVETLDALPPTIEGNRELLAWLRGERQAPPRLGTLTEGLEAATATTIPAVAERPAPKVFDHFVDAPVAVGLLSGATVGLAVAPKLRTTVKGSERAWRSAPCGWANGCWRWAAAWPCPAWYPSGSIPFRLRRCSRPRRKPRGSGGERRPLPRRSHQL